MSASRWGAAIAVAISLAGCDDRTQYATGAGGASVGGMGGMGGSGGGGTGGTMTDGVVVDTPSGRLASETADGYCDILEAVAAVTEGRSVRECANPNGSKRIILKGGASYPITKTLRFAIPTDTKHPFQIGIAEAMTGSATITAAEPWLLDPGDPPTSCLLHMSGGPTVELSDITLTQAPSLGVTGACVVRGTLRVRHGRVTGFKKGGVIVTCQPDKGCDFDAGDFAMVQVANSLVDGNATDGDGGGIYSIGFGATVVVYHSSIVNNTAAGAGGGAYFGGGWNTYILRSSTVSGNRANVGGGVMVKFECSNTYLHMFYSTVFDNTAHGTGGGIEFEPADLLCAKQDVTVYASIVAGNHSATTLESNINSAWFTNAEGREFGIFECLEGSIIYVTPGEPRPTAIDAPCFFDIRDPRLGPLMPMGGAGDLPAHPLLAGSPAIDVGPTDHAIDDQRDVWIPLIDPPLTDAWTLFDRLADGDGDGRIAPDFGAIEMNPRWQAELLTVAAKGPSSHQVVVTPAGLDRGAGMAYGAASATNEFVTYRLPIAEPGSYDITAGVLQTPAGGKFQVAIANAPNGPWTDLGPAQDGFAASPTFAAFGPFTAPLFATAGEKLIRFTVTGRNAASAGYNLTLDYVDARRSTKACPVAQIASGANYTCALAAAGGVRCWGGNDDGQLGDGSKATAWRAPAVDTVVGVAAIAAGARHTCVLTTAGGVRCWGANASGQLGDGTTTGRASPPASDVLTGVKAIAAGTKHTCALTIAGGVRCWGGNESGQLGNGGIADRSMPAASDVLTGVKAIAAGSSNTCALMQTGGVRCWGANMFGQLGDGTTTDRATPPTADALTGVMALSVGDGHTCAVTTAGGVRCWGHNSDGQIGDDTPNATERFAPAATDVLAGVQSIAVGSAHVCARMTSGGVRCWGANAAGQLGDGLVPEPAATPPPVDVVNFTGTCP